MQEELTDPQPARKSFSWFRVFGCLVVILGVPYWILYPVFRSARVAAERAQEEQMVRTAVLAVIRDMAEHGDRYPSLRGDMRKSLQPYIKDQSVIDAMPRFTWNDKLAGMKEQDVENPSEQWVVYSKGPTPGMAVIGFADGHTRSASAEYLTSMLRNDEAGGIPDDVTDPYHNMPTDPPPGHWRRK